MSRRMFWGNIFKYMVHFPPRVMLLFRFIHAHIHNSAGNFWSCLVYSFWGDRWSSPCFVLPVICWLEKSGMSWNCILGWNRNMETFCWNYFILLKVLWALLICWHMLGTQGSNLREIISGRVTFRQLNVVLQLLNGQSPQEREWKESWREIKRIPPSKAGREKVRIGVYAVVWKFKYSGEKSFGNLLPGFQHWHLFLIGFQIIYPF